MRMKHLTALLLASCISVTAVPVTAPGFAVTANAETAGDYEYGVNNDDGTVIITGYSGSDTELVIPAQIDGQPVTTIGNYAFSDCTGLTSVTIPEGVTEIGNYVFSGCTSLSEISIPESVISIGESAFSETAWLEARQKEDPLVMVNGILIDGKCCEGDVVIIPEGVTSIGSAAFSGCTGLTSVTIPESVTSIGYAAFMGCTGLTSVTIPGSVSSIGVSAFSNCSSLTSVTIPESVTFIKGSAFSGCTGLTSVTIPESVTFIEASAFRDCTGLTSVTIPEGVTSIGYQAFGGCTSLSEISIPESVDSIGESAFSGTAWLEARRKEDPLVTVNGILIDGMCCEGDVVIPEGVTRIMNDAFIRSALTSVTIPGSVRSIGRFAFSDCSSLTSVTMQEGVTTLCDAAFARCSALTDIVFPDSLVYFGEDALYGTPWLEQQQEKPFVIAGSYLMDGRKSTGDIVIPDGIRTIGYYAFGECDGLTSVTIPESVTEIGARAFWDCTALTDITIPDSVAMIGEGAFSYTPWLEDREAQADPLVTAGNVVIGTKGCEGDFTIPDGIVGIAPFAFSECDGLTSVTIPDSVTKIGFFAFSGSGVTFTVPAGVTVIGHDAFGTDATIRGYDGSTAQAYAKENNIPFISLGAAPAAALLGDVDNSGEVDSVDASLVLVAAAALGLDQPSGLDAEAEKRADVDGNGTVNSVDASIILTYAAAQGLSETPLDLIDYVPKS